MSNSSTVDFLKYVLPLLLFCLLIFLISASSDPPAPDFNLDWGDKVNHAGAFGVMMLLAFRASRWVLAARSLRSQIMAAFLYCILYGATDEIHQAFVPDRSCDLLDWVADAAGATLAGLFVLWTLKWKVARFLYGPAH